VLAAAEARLAARARALDEEVAERVEQALAAATAQWNRDSTALVGSIEQSLRAHRGDAQRLAAAFAAARADAAKLREQVGQDCAKG